jgi:hypothetical protein
MAGSRTLKLSILGDVDNLTKSLKTAGGDVDSFGDKIGKAGLAIGKAFAAAAAAAGVAAIAIGIDGVKAAIEDEKAQTQLALALENATGATKAQIAATEDSILKMSLATGVADDQLRPALGRLVRSTGDITKAQDLLTTALDVATATGKPLETVANAIGKAYDGNTAALGKLGIGLSAAELKTMDFTAVQDKLSELFGGAAARNAETYDGKIARLKVSFDEAKETIGQGLLPMVTSLIDYININVLPAFNAFALGFNGKGKLKDGMTTTEAAAFGFGETVKGLTISLGKMFTVFNSEANTGQSSGLGKMIGWLNTIINALDKVVKFASFTLGVLGAITDPSKWGMSASDLRSEIEGKISGQSFATTGAPGAIRGGGSTGSTIGGSTLGGGSTGSTVGGMGGVARAASVVANVAKSVAGGGFTDSQNAARLSAMGGGGFTDSQNAARISITVNGAIDKEGTARTIVETLNSSYYRGTGGATALVAI